MKPPTQLARLLAEIDRLGALMDGVASAAERCPFDLEYPRLFSDLMREHAFVAFVVGGVRVHSNLRGEADNLEELLRDKALTRELYGAGFAPFGRPSTGNYDRICFDMRGRRHPFDAPVVVMDHESILSHNQIPKPRKLADSLVELFALEAQKAEPSAPPN
jgi:hypothetical protein